MEKRGTAHSIARVRATPLRSVGPREASALRAVEVYRAELAELNARRVHTGPRLDPDAQAQAVIELADQVAALRELVAGLIELAAELAVRLT